MVVPSAAVLPSRLLVELRGGFTGGRDALFGGVFVPRSGNHHDFGLFGVGTADGPKRRGTIGLYHLAWQVNTIDELAEARRALLANGAYTGESSHGVTNSVYGADPDGQRVRDHVDAAPRPLRRLRAPGAG
ncbi:MAG: VOC family protein [Actinomycetota bacterium]|nr:VOC family protein [Actinomycetota bacterium]